MCEGSGSRKCIFPIDQASNGRRLRFEDGLGQVNLTLSWSICYLLRLDVEWKGKKEKELGFNNGKAKGNLESLGPIT